MQTGESGSEDSAPRRVDRRTLIAGGGSAAAAVLWSRTEAAAADSPPPVNGVYAGVLIARVAAHDSATAIDVVGVADGSAVVIEAGPATQVVGLNSSSRPLDDVGLGEAVAVLAPNIGLTPSGETVVAQRVVPCVIGQRRDVSR